MKRILVFSFAKPRSAEDHKKSAIRDFCSTFCLLGPSDSDPWIIEHILTLTSSIENDGISRTLMKMLMVLMMMKKKKKKKEKMLLVTFGHSWSLVVVIRRTLNGDRLTGQGRRCLPACGRA